MTYIVECLNKASTFVLSLHFGVAHVSVLRYFFDALHFDCDSSTTCFSAMHSFRWQLQLLLLNCFNYVITLHWNMSSSAYHLAIYIYSLYKLCLGSSTATTMNQRSKTIHSMVEKGIGKAGEVPGTIRGTGEDVEGAGQSGPSGDRSTRSWDP